MKRAHIAEKIASYKTAHDGVEPRRCDWHGCGELAEHKAPKSPDRLREYYWFCLDHVREYNTRWNYFDGMPAEEVEQFQRDSVIGHRPTWKMGNANRPRYSAANPERLRQKLYRMFGEDLPEDYASGYSLLPARQKKALAVMNLEHPTTLPEIKNRYRALVKKYHPDVNPDDKRAEEMFKKVSIAYRYLLTCDYA